MTTELETARAMSRGELSSPQPFENSALFCMRISGTGLAYRPALREHVWRDPTLWLTDETLARCAGLPVIVSHPDGKLLDSEEFASRVVGTVIYPFLQDGEVWGVARIFDEAAIEALASGDYSTSPAVSFGDGADNQSFRLEDGSSLLVEGEPRLLDHLAIVAPGGGVWDKGSSDSPGVRIDRARACA